MKKRRLLCVVLAAGKGTRMKSNVPKVLHQVAGLPMVNHVIGAAQALAPDQIVVVIGPDTPAVADAVAPHETVIQHDRLGTGHAVRVALEGRDLQGTDVLVLFGDVPLVPPEALVTLIERHRGTDTPVITILAMKPSDPTGYGRLDTTPQHYVREVIEQADLRGDQEYINLCSSGMMILRGEGLNDALKALKNDNAKGEYYLLDILPPMVAAGERAAYVLGSPDDLNGVNDRVQLAAAEKRMQDRLRDRAMKGGVTMIDPATVYLSTDTQLGSDVLIEPNVVIGEGVVVEDGVIIHAHSYLEGVTIKADAKVGPFVRIRPGTVVGPRSKVNNFVELKKTILGERVDISQLCCVVDSDVGDHVNIGAGTITSNYDGVNKFRTIIGARSFIGSNSTLVAPVTIGDDGFVSAGSVITDTVPSGHVAFGRARQVNRPHTEKTIQFSQKHLGKK
jgi:bifunctional UDP-N-acetylglucosamine pyrophosphorylase/glucosamine-1-phosphate N-acetyltransferase